jgi:hypothetical protein
MSSLKLLSWSIVSNTFLYACACDVFALNPDLPWLAKQIRDASTKKTGSIEVREKVSPLLITSRRKNFSG